MSRPRNRKAEAPAGHYIDHSMPVSTPHPPRHGLTITRGLDWATFIVEVDAPDGTPRSFEIPCDADAGRAIMAILNRQAIRAAPPLAPPPIAPPSAIDTSIKPRRFSPSGKELFTIDDLF